MSSNLPAPADHRLDSVPDLQLYPYLLRLAVLANKLAESEMARKQALENSDTDGAATHPVTFSKLPKGSLKALMSYFKHLALDKQENPVDSGLKRSYLAFYTTLLDLKSNDFEQFEELSQRAEQLIVRFSACVTKVAGKQLVASQGVQFVQLLRQIARKQGGSASLDAQLGEREQQFVQQPAQPVKMSTPVPTDAQIVAAQVARVMLVSPTLFNRDIASEQTKVSLGSTLRLYEELRLALQSDQHPFYSPQDFESYKLWHSFVSEEQQEIAKLLQEIPQESEGAEVAADLIPQNPHAYLSAFLERCIEADLKEQTLFTSKTKALIAFVGRYWRAGPKRDSHAHIACLLSAVANLFHKELIPLSIVDDCYGYVEHLLATSTVDNDMWPQIDVKVAMSAIETMRDDLGALLAKTVGQLFEPQAPKFGPILHAMTINLPSFADFVSGGECRDYLVATPTQIWDIERGIVGSAETQYNRWVSLIPRDQTLEVDNIVKLIEEIINSAQKLQRKYKKPMFDRLPIAKMVCAKQIQLLAQDFEPIWSFCLKQYAAKKTTPPFESMVALHDEVTTLTDLADRFALPKDLIKFDPEDLLYPYFQDWATESSKLCLKWVQPAIDNDDNQPIDQPSGKMYSTGIKDLFSSFYASVSLVKKMDWSNKYYASRLLTTIVDGIAIALRSWAAKIQVMFMEELATGAKPPAKLPATTVREQQAEWLSLAREATAQAAAAMLARNSKQLPTFNFKRESGVKLNNVLAAYDMLHSMESQVNADAISQTMREKSKATRPSTASVSRQQGTTYLFTVTIIGAIDVKYSNKGLYLTLVDHDTHKQLGKTHVANSSNPNWNKSFEFVVSNRPRLLRATIWSDGAKNLDHEVCGRAMIRLDAKQYAKKEYGMQLRSIDLESGSGKLQVILAVDQQIDDIRFHFGKAMRYLKRTQDVMINIIVEKFSEFINSVLSRPTLRIVTGQNSLSNGVQTGVSQLQKSFSSWLGRPLTDDVSTMPTQPESVHDLVDRSLEPLYNYLNKNFAVLAGILTHPLRIEVLSHTWDVVLEALEALILPPLEAAPTSQTALTSGEMEAVYMWLSNLREFFHSDGAGPSLERLQNQNYQQIMAIPVYYDLPTVKLKSESEKVARSSLQTLASNTELLARQGTVMAHRNKSVIEHQASQLRMAQRASPKLDDIILRTLRLRGEIMFIDQHLKFRERLLQHEMTERALQGSIF